MRHIKDSVKIIKIKGEKYKIFTRTFLIAKIPSEGKGVLKFNQKTYENNEQ